MRVAGGAVADARAQQFLLAGQKLRPRRAHGEHDGSGFHHFAFHQQHKAVVRGENLAHEAVLYVHAHFLRLRLEGLQQLRPGAPGQAGIIVDVFRAGKPARVFRRTHDQRFQPAHPGGDGAAQARGALADDRDIYHAYFFNRIAAALLSV
jgi:hypothetical protein